MMIFLMKWQEKTKKTSRKAQKEGKSSLHQQIQIVMLIKMKSERGKEQLASTDSDCNADKDEAIPSAIPVAEKQTNSMATCGALVTELENSETIETINLENHKKIYIADLPDLEEVEISETEDVLTSQCIDRKLK
ncbi:UNVERIFIED_CONTAM: hypothetical protein FKN15_029745 [Acipenser sinensis]